MIDFDGTVTEDDLLDRIARDFGDPAVYQEVEDGLDAGTMALREVITREFRPVTTPLDEVVSWVLENVRVRAGFRELVDQAPWVPLFTPRFADFVSERVGNYQANTYASSTVLLDQLWVR